MHNDLSKMTIGFSAEGLKEYQNDLKAKILTETKDELRATNGIKEALKTGWQGMSKDKFVVDMDEAIERIIFDLEAEYNDIVNRLQQLENNYLNQDSQML